MRKNLLILAFILLHSSFSIAQEWFPVGAKWTYEWRINWYTYWGGDPVVYEVEKDTVVLGQSCRKIVEVGNSSNYSFRYYEAGKVYYLKDAFHSNPAFDTTWNLLYDFTANVGDTIFYPSFAQYNPNDTTRYYVIVDSTYQMIINGDTLNAYNGMAVNEMCIVCGINVVEGSIERIYGGEIEWWGIDWLPSLISNPTGVLRCYEDSYLGLYTNPNFLLDCDTSYRITSLNESLIQPNHLRVYPNPANGILHLTSERKIRDKDTFKIYDLNGKEIETYELSEPTSTLDISHLEPGMYIWEFRSNQNRVRDKLIIR